MPEVADPAVLTSGVMKLTRFIAPIIGVIGGALAGRMLASGADPVRDAVRNVVVAFLPVSAFGTTGTTDMVVFALTIIAWLLFFFALSWGVGLLGKTFAPVRKALIIGGLTFAVSYGFTLFLNAQPISGGP